MHKHLIVGDVCWYMVYVVKPGEEAGFLLIYAILHGRYRVKVLIMHTSV